MRLYNFSAGPSMLPLEVLTQAGKEMTNYCDKGLSVMEMSHRTSAYMDIHDEAISLLKELMNIPDNYKILFVQGGASQQFAAVPLNLMKDSKSAAYAITGNFANQAYKEASRLIDNAKIVSSSEDKNFTYIPDIDKNMLDCEDAYLHITTNNTIFGTKYSEIPDVGDIPIVADMSSNILSEEFDVSKFGVIYAGAQKNIGPAGVTVVIIREDLLDKYVDSCPTMLKYKTHADKNSMYNTPPTYGIYIAMLVFRWLKGLGGVSSIAETNKYKANLLYDFIDNSDFYTNNVNKKDRSIMNVPFVTKSEELNAKFVKESLEKGLLSLKGHRLVGGMRASIYNAMPVEGVKALIEFMKDFEMNNRI